jgi:hypothetical protein
MLIDYTLGQTSIVLRVKILNSSVTTGAGLTGLTNASSGLIISTIADNESSATTYTVAGSTIDTITTLGTYATPTATHCRFKEVDSTNHKGVYEIQIADARFAVSNAKSLLISVLGATNAAETDCVIPLRSVNPYDGVHGGMSALPNTACTTNASLLTSGTGTDQISVSAGKVLLQATQTGVTIPTVTTVTNQLTAAAIATGVWQDSTAGDFTTASSIGKSLYTTGNAPGAASGLAIVGSAMTLAASQHVIVDSGTVTTVTNQLTAAQVATGVWQDATAGDFTIASSIGKSLYTTGNAPGAASGIAIVGSNMGTATSVSGAVGSVTGNVGGNVVGSVASVTAAVAVTSNIKKNQALANFEFLMTDSTNHNPATGKTVTCTRSIDGGAFASGTLANVAEVASGIYRVDFGAGDLNGNVVTLRATASGCDDTLERVVTQP